MVPVVGNPVTESKTILVPDPPVPKASSPKAPFKVLDGKGYSWSYEKSNGLWEIEKPKKLLLEFFTELFKVFNSKDVYVLGFSQGGLVCLDFVLFLEKLYLCLHPNTS